MRHVGRVEEGVCGEGSLREQAVAAACRGQLSSARQLFRECFSNDLDADTQAQLLSDLATLDAIEGKFSAAHQQLQAALTTDPDCVDAQWNLRQLESFFQGAAGSNIPHLTTKTVNPRSGQRPRIAILSLLFNWPSTGGGTIHTYEAAKFLQRAGFDVRQIYARQSEWGLGNVREPLAVDSVPLEFALEEWSPEVIRERFRAAVQDFAPDAVIITDSWNTKPLLAEAVHDYPYFLRIAAQECLCPLNNVRLLMDARGPQQCQRVQFRDPQGCRDCVQQNGRFSGSLHQAERELAGFFQTDYRQRLQRAFRNAAGVLAVNPFVAESLRGANHNIQVIPSGFDPERFQGLRPEPLSVETGRKQIFFAGLTQELMKGFHVLLEAGELLWQQRQDFEIVATDTPAGPLPPFVRSLGWQSQSELPQRISEADILAFPTIAQEALGRSAVEAMGCGRPVVASRLGGLPWVVEDGVTGLLFEPSDARDLARQLDRLLSDPGLCRRLGAAGQQKFEREFTWDVIIERSYRPLFQQVLQVR